MLEQKFHRGFAQDRLETTQEPRIRQDERGFYTITLSERTKVYFDDFYGFLEATYEKAAGERRQIAAKLEGCTNKQSETASYYRARMVIIDLLMRTIRRFYTDGSNLGVVMTPWCFGTVVLEKIEVYRDRMSKGEVNDPNVGDYPYYVVKYVDEIYKMSLLELFDFPEKAFQMRWQYSELLKRYSKILTDISGSLQSVIKSVRNMNS